MAEEIVVRSQQGVLVPVDDEGESAIINLDGKEVMARLWLARSLKHNRWAHKLFALVADNHPFLQTPQAVKTDIKLRLGMFDPVITASGKLVYVMHSTSFAAMDQQEFQTFIEGAERVICKDLLPGITSDEIAMEIMRFLR
jgi:hypothetical protein